MTSQWPLCHTETSSKDMEFLPRNANSKFGLSVSGEEVLFSDYGKVLKVTTPESSDPPKLAIKFHRCWQTPKVATPPNLTTLQK